MIKKVFLIVFMLFALYSIPSYSDETNGCCTVPRTPGLTCTTTTQSGCPDPYFIPGRNCEEVQSCAEKNGCCTDNSVQGVYCTTVSYRADCPGQDTFNAGKQCAAVPDCQTGCCLCNDRSTCKTTFFGINDKQCNEKCSSIGFTYSLETNILSASDCVTRCGSDTLPLFKVSGTVKNHLGRAVQGATVSIFGKGSTTTGAQGNYQLFVEEGTYFITAEASGFSKLTEQITVSAATTKDFTLNPLTKGQVSGIVASTTQAAIPNAVVSLGGTGFIANVLTDSDGQYLITDVPFGSYTASASASGYTSSDNVPVTLDSSTPSATSDFSLEKRNPGILRVIVQQNISRAISPLPNAVVELSEAQGINQQCRTASAASIHPGTGIRIDIGGCLFNTYQGIHELTVSKSAAFKSVVRNVDVQQSVTTITVVLQTEKVCDINGELVRTGSCAVLNKPAYCENGDISATPPLNDYIEGFCYGNDKIVGNADDCGCPRGTTCNADNGYCIPNIYNGECTDACTYLGDNYCHKECDGTAGCAFKSDETKSLCNNQLAGSRQFSVGSNTIYPGSVSCCEGSLKSISDTTEEICNNGKDDDGDGYTDCADPVCYNKVCGADKVCRAGASGKISCELELCATYTGLVTKDCACGYNILNQKTAQAGQYCCHADANVGNKAAYENSACGTMNNACTTTGNGQCCYLGCKTEGPDVNQYAKYDSACNKDGGSNNVCCPKNDCLDYSNFCCETQQQCDASQRSDAGTICSKSTAVVEGQTAQKTGCKVPCNSLLPCKPGIRDSYSQTAPYCLCGGIIDSSIHLSEYCCYDNTKKAYGISSTACASSGPAGVLTGTVVDDATGDPIPQASIILPQLQVLTNNDGVYSVELAVGQYQVFAGKQDYKDSLPLPAVIAEDKDTTLNFRLTKLFDPCDTSPKPVTSFTASHILGEVYKVKLAWQKPDCLHLLSYTLKRLKNNNVQETFTIDATQTGFTDATAQPQTAYTYELVPNYRLSRGAKATATITTGDTECQDKFVNGKSVEFCVDRNKGYTCDMNNKKNPLLERRDNYINGECIEPTKYFCTGPGSSGKIGCRKAEQCGFFIQKAEPFGLYYQKDRCHETDDIKNYCYYDVSSTVVDRCYGCESLGAGSIQKNDGSACYNYKSADACITDNCGVGLKDGCGWYGTIYTNLGKGFCYKEDYNKTDKCSLCSSLNSPFYNTYCTQDVCDVLGNCLSTADKKSCVSCETAACEDYGTEEQCAGGQNIAIANGHITTSNDKCKIGKCRWDGSNNKCFKDGNGQQKADCVLSKNGGDLDIREYAYNPEYSNERRCITDRKSPITKLIAPQEFRQLTQSTENLSFTVDGTGIANLGRTLLYCIDKDNSCDPAQNSVAYLGQAADIIVETIKDMMPSDGIYYLRFASIDTFFNQEEVQSIPFYADLHEPVLDVAYTIELNPAAADSNAVSKLHFTITSNEFAKCTGTLADLESKTGSIRPASPQPQDQENTRFFVTYDVIDSIYRYTLACTDLFLNSKEIIVDNIEVDAYKLVKLGKPHLSAVNSSKVMFSAETDIPAGCILQKGTFGRETKLADFFSRDKRKHNVSVEIPDQNAHYPSATESYSIHCTPVLSTAKPDSAVYHFTVDKIAPETSLQIYRNAVDFANFSEDQWNHFTNTLSDITMGCKDPFIDGSEMVFGAEPGSMYGCLAGIHAGKPINGFCEPKTYMKTAAELKAAILNDAGYQANKYFIDKLCYSCSDEGWNTAAVKCGIIELDKNGPGFTILITDTDLNLPTTTMVRRNPEKVYSISVTSDKALNKTPVLHIAVGDVRYPLPLSLTKVNDKEYSATFKVPPHFDIANIGIISLQHVNFFDNLDEDNDTHFELSNINDVFGNTDYRIVYGRNFTIDTTPPKPPVFYNLFREETVMQQPVFSLAGYCCLGRKLADMLITISRAARKTEGWNLMADYSAEDPLFEKTIRLAQQPLEPTKIVVDEAPYNLEVGYSVMFTGLEDTDRRFYEIVGVAQHPLGLLSVLTLDRALAYPLESYAAGSAVSVYRHALPLGWFGMNIPLQEGTTWLYGIATDNADNPSEPTATYRIIQDTQMPDLLALMPGNGDIIGGAVTISAYFTDQNSGLEFSTANITLGETRYTCFDSGVICSNTGRFLSINVPGLELADGVYDMAAAVSDKAGNTRKETAQFTVDSDVPSMPELAVEPSNCYEHDLCYTADSMPALRLVFAEDVDVESVTLGGLLTGEIQDSKTYRYSVADALADGAVTLSYSAAKSGSPVFGRGTLHFVVDTTKPELSLIDIGETNKPAVTMQAFYSEPYPYRMKFKGDIAKEESLDERGIHAAAQLSLGEHYIEQQLVLDIGTDEPEKTITVNLTDKAGNSVERTITAVFSIDVPILSDFSVEFAPGSIVAERAEDYYRTNSLSVTLRGTVDKKLKTLLLLTSDPYSSPAVRYAHPAFEIAYTFDLDYGREQATAMQIYMRDEADNEIAYPLAHPLIVELDRKPATAVISNG